MDQPRRQPHHLQKSLPHPRRPHPHRPPPPDLLIKDSASKHRKFFVSKKLQQGDRFETLQSISQSRTRTNHRRLHLRTKIPRSQPPRLAKSRSRKNRQTRLHRLRRQRPSQSRRRAPHHLSELQTVSGIGPEKADRYGADIIALCRSDALPNLLHTADKKSSSRPKPSQPSHGAPVSAVAVASRYPKASALGLSESDRNRALAPGVSSPAAETFTRPRATTPEPRHPHPRATSPRPTPPRLAQSRVRKTQSPALLRPRLHHSPQHRPRPSAKSIPTQNHPRPRPRKD